MPITSEPSTSTSQFIADSMNCGLRTRLLAPSRALGSPSIHIRRRSSQHSITKRSATALTKPGSQAVSIEKVDRVNPPNTTRPPPLEIPSRDPSGSTFSYYIQVGKAYLGFYKTGVKNVFHNRSLLNSRISSLPQDDIRPSIFRPRNVPRAFSRADWVLFWRVRHDTARIPVFALVLLICGEFTPLVAVFLEGIMPYTCRLPQKRAVTQARAEVRRSASLTNFERQCPGGLAGDSMPAGQRKRAARAHILRGLDLIGRVWDRAGIVPPGMWALKGQWRIAFLEGDDALLHRDGVDVLSEEELQIACSQRGIDVLDRKKGELMKTLRTWLLLTQDEDVSRRRGRIAVLLTTR
jgi:hypothetical protein